jgi:hypothetical protein
MDQMELGVVALMEQVVQQEQADLLEQVASSGLTGTSGSRN